MVLLATGDILPLEMLNTETKLNMIPTGNQHQGCMWIVNSLFACPDWEVPGSLNIETSPMVVISWNRVMLPLKMQKVI